MRASITVLLTLLLTVGCARPPAPLSADHAAALGDSARAFLREFSRLSEAAQWDSLSQLYSTRADFRFLESGEVRYTSAAAIGEDRGTIEDIYEPFLIQEGYLDRTPRGRIATPRAYQHFGVTPARDIRQEKLL